MDHSSLNDVLVLIIGAIVGSLTTLFYWNKRRKK